MRFTSMLPLRPQAPAAFDQAKAAQIAAFFVLRLGGTAGFLKLIKLLYLAERESLIRYGAQLTGDRLCSLKNGPVLSETLNYIRGESTPPEVWTHYFQPSKDEKIRLRSSDLTEDELPRLSEADVELLNHVWKNFGHKTPHQLWVYVHDLPEYEDPGNSSRPIKIPLLLEDEGFSQEQIEEIVERIEEQNQYQAALKKAAV